MGVNPDRKSEDASWKNEEEERLPGPEEARGPPLEPGPEEGLVSERLVAGLTTEPGRAQPEQVTWKLTSLRRHVGPPPAVGTSGVGCAATWVAVTAGVSDRPILGSRG